MKHIGGVLVLLVLVGCTSDESVENEVAALRAKVAAQEKALREERKVSALHKKVADGNFEQLKSEKARADALQLRLDHVGQVIDRELTSVNARIASLRQSTNTPTEASMTVASEPSQWQQMEADQKRRREEWERRLESTTVYVNAADRNPKSYHASGCDALYATEIVNGIAYSRYASTPVTLKAAYDRRLSRHTCGPESYERR